MVYVASDSSMSWLTVKMVLYGSTTVSEISGLGRTE